MGTILETSRGPRREARLALPPSGRLFEHVFTWLERSRQRRALASLDEHRLKDIGLTTGEAEREWRKPFWQK